MVKCEECGVELHEDDCYDTIFKDQEIILLMIGHCPKCEQEYEWEKIYRLADITGPRLIL